MQTNVYIATFTMYMKFDIHRKDTIFTGTKLFIYVKLFINLLQMNKSENPLETKVVWKK